jgi:fructose-bisphosphate aldolase class II
MLDRARAERFAYPAVNVTSSQTLNAALAGFADAGSDGIVQITPGAAGYLAGRGGCPVTGAVALAELARVLARRWPVHIAHHPDHCPPALLGAFLRPLLARSRRAVGAGGEPLFQGHMWDGSSLPIDANLATARELLDAARDVGVVLEVEIGVVGGEEDGLVGAADGDSTPADALRVAERLGLGEHGRYLLAATFGNVHGRAAPGVVHLRPQILDDLQRAVGEAHGCRRPFAFVFHGGSGSDPADVRTAIDHGVVKVNVDTDAQYAFTRPIADHVLRRYDGVLRVDGALGDKAAYDPRSWGRAAEAGMAARVRQACEALGSAGRRLS